MSTRHSRQNTSDSPRDRKRFTTGNHPNIEDISDPHTTDDETHEPLRKRAWEYRWFLALGLPIGIAAVFILIGYTWHLIPELITNRYVQLGGAFVATVAGSAYFADRRRMSWFENTVWLVLRTPDGPVRYLCHLRRNGDGTPHALPIKGYRWFGSVPEYYTIEEFGRELAETWANINRDPDDPAVIRLHPKLVSMAETDLGTVVEQPTGGLEVDPFARDSTLYATMPEFIEEDVAEDLRTELIRLREEREELESRLEDVQRRLEAAKDAGAMTPEEFLESHKEFTTDIIAVARGRTDSLTDSDTNTDNTSTGTAGGRDLELEQVEAELTQND